MKDAFKSNLPPRGQAFAAIAALVLVILVPGCSTGTRLPSTNATPVMNVLSLFTATNVPAMGFREPEIPLPDYMSNAVPVTDLPGKGLAQHPMLYFGEYYNRLFVINDGKVIWSYNTAPIYSPEIDDAWLLSNGDILFSRLSYAAEVNPQKKIVWRLDPEDTCSPRDDECQAQDTGYHCWPEPARSASRDSDRL